jgi:hypothetical protein
MVWGKRGRGGKIDEVIMVKERTEMNDKSNTGGDVQEPTDLNHHS